MENLGKRAKDKVTGFEGIITGVVFYIDGRQRYGIEAMANDSKYEEAAWFDAPRIEIIG